MSGQGEEALIRASTAAKRLGVSVRTLWDWERKGKLIPRRIRRQRYYSEAEIERRAIERALRRKIRPKTQCDDNG